MLSSQEVLDRKSVYPHTRLQSLFGGFCSYIQSQGRNEYKRETSPGTRIGLECCSDTRRFLCPRLAVGTSLNSDSHKHTCWRNRNACGRKYCLRGGETVRQVWGSADKITLTRPVKYSSRQTLAAAVHWNREVRICIYSRKWRIVAGSYWTIRGDQGGMLFRNSQGG